LGMLFNPAFLAGIRGECAKQGGDRSLVADNRYQLECPGRSKVARRITKLT
jgi:hypothetical protein